MIDRSLPKEYQDETDYRKIPRKYLNPRIPKGRGIIKWQAFKTIPEQYQKIDKYIQEQNKIDKPSLSDTHLDTLNNNLSIKLHFNQQATIEYYLSGYIYSIQGYIKVVDSLNGILIITNERGNEEKKIPLDTIVNLY